MNLEELYRSVQQIGVAKTAQNLGISRQAVYDRLNKHPDWKPHKVENSPRCPNCESDRTVGNGKSRGIPTYICKECNHRWREKLMVVRLSEISKKLL